MAIDQDAQKRQIAAALRRLERMKVIESFDPVLDLDSRPSPRQLEVMQGINKFHHRYLRCANQVGKSTIGAREVSWVFEENHPHWKRPKEWMDEPLLILVVGRVGKQAEESLWRKIKTYLEPGKYKEVRSSGSLQAIKHDNGNTILFLSHHSEREAKEKMQSYVAHYVWVDEMPSSHGIFEELHRRIESRNGYFLATFTPKVKNESIRKFVDAQETVSYAKVYRLNKFDNPIFAGREAEVMEKMAGLSEKEKNAILYGDWMDDDNIVYHFDSSSMVIDRLPPHYGPHWRHVEGVDPALKSKFGMILLAEDPGTYNWYVVRAEYISGIYVPTDMVNHVRTQLAGYNIVRRMSDPHEPWYIEQANSMGIKPVYQGVYDKHNRKGQLMKSLQEALGVRLFVCSWCVDLIEEFQSMRWAEGDNEKIVNSSSFHLIDALQYGLDGLPKAEKIFLTQDPVQQLREAHEQRISQEIIKAAQPQRKHWKTFKITTSRRTVWN